MAFKQEHSLKTEIDVKRDEFDDLAGQLIHAHMNSGEWNTRLESHCRILLVQLNDLNQKLLLAEKT